MIWKITKKNSQKDNNNANLKKKYKFNKIKVQKKKMGKTLKTNYRYSNKSKGMMNYIYIEGKKIN